MNVFVAPTPSWRRPRRPPSFLRPAREPAIVPHRFAIDSKKQPLAVLEAFRRARQHVNCSLLIVGAGELEGEIHQEIARWDIQDVVLAGFMGQPEVPRAFACADAFILFSRYNETWGVVVNEAMNFGLPVLVSDKVGSGTDLVEDSRNGYVIATEDIESLSARMVQLAEDSKLREKLGRRSLEMIDKWNVEAATQGIVDAVRPRSVPPDGLARCALNGAHRPASNPSSSFIYPWWPRNAPRIQSPGGAKAGRLLTNRPLVLSSQAPLAVAPS